MCTTTKSPKGSFSFNLWSAWQYHHTVSIRRWDGLRIRRLLLSGLYSCGISGCDSISGLSIPASVFGCIQEFYSSVPSATMLGFLLGLGLEMPPPWSVEDGSGFDASAFHQTSVQCTNEESGVVG